MAAELIGQGPAQEPPPVRLVIELANGNVTVSGPINDRLLCMGMLELAKLSIIEHGYRVARQQQQEQRALTDMTSSSRESVSGAACSRSAATR